ncbi:MAG: CBS domain-containing protein, partial [Pseudomonadota bacterium]
MNIQDRIEFRSKPKPLKTVDSTTVADAVAMMTERNFGSIIATGADGRMTGLFTERDVMRRVVNEGRDPKTTPLADVMTKEVRVAKADDDVVDWLRTMSNERFRRLPVVDETGDV